MDEKLQVSLNHHTQTLLCTREKKKGQEGLTVPRVVHAVEKAGRPSPQPGTGGACRIHVNPVLLVRCRRRRRWRSSGVELVIRVRRGRRIHFACLGEFM
jgi:hypothetical protein